MDGRSFVLRDLVIAGAIVWTAACGGEGAAPGDADGSVGDAGVATPVAPMPVTMACREGWRARTVASGASVCEPWPSDGPIACAAAEAAIPGRGCVTIGATCPADGWPAELPPTGVIYVRAGAMDGDGTRERPFGTLAEGAAASEGLNGVLALAVGEYEGFVDMKVRRIFGACASGTIIRDPRTEGDATIVVRPNDGEVRDVTVVSAAVTAAIFVQDVRFEMRRVVLESPVIAARLESRASVVMEDVILRTPEGTTVPTLAARVSSGSSLTLRRGFVRGSIGMRSGPDVEVGSSTVVLEDVAIQDASFGVFGEFGTVEARGVVIERVELGFGVSPWTHATLEDVVVRELHSVPGVGGEPEAIFASGTVDAERLWIADVEGPAIGISSAERIRMSEPPAHLDLTDVVVEDVIAPEAVRAQGGTLATIERIDVARVQGDAIAADGAGTSLTLRDATISDVTTVGNDGDAIAIALGASATIERVAARGTARGALVIAGAGTHVDASDIDVDVRGRGVMAQCAITAGELCGTVAAPVEVTLRRARIVDSQVVAIGADEAHLTLEDVSIDRVSAGGPLDGFGIAAASGRIDGTRVEIARATRHAVVAYGAGGAIELSALRVTDTQPSPPCEGEGCARERLGDAITCAEGASMMLRDFVAERAASAGVMLVQGCAAQFERGRIVDNALGVLTDATVTQPRFVDVFVDENGTNYGTTTLSVARPTF
ncbi:hypothetical protein [Sandaracinus amylolyticus]|uniref:hypothetical protein n=1 Tax=Sandaracinus amylolyticus TaxID=927083 RepID=UPI001F2705DF|nr:hypothetical protein [Sandaracinus amylolyticus]UJR83887.1 Hypothetical protein I5071_59580 [Sandaracinus amylolyticus]